MLDRYNLTALVVDDLANMRALMKAQLKAIGIDRIAEASSAAAALEKMREQRVDLLLLDYYLGEAMDGQQLLELVRNERLIASSAVVLMVTAEKAYAAVAKVAEHSPDAYLVKPFSADRLHDTLLPIFERKLGVCTPSRTTPGLKPLYAQFDAGRHDAVIALVDAMTAKEGIRTDTARLKAESLLAQGRLVAAMQFFDSVKERYAWAALGLARTRMQLGETRAAIATLETLVQDSPMYVHALDVLAEAYLRDKRPEQAMALLEQGCGQSPTVRRMRQAAQVAEQLGAGDKVLKWAEQVVHDNRHAAHQDYSDHARHLRALIQAGQLDRAASTLADYGKKMPALHDSAAAVAAKILLLAEQIAAEDRSLQQQPESIRQRRNGLQQEKTERLRKLVGRLAGMTPETPEAAVSAGEVLYRMGLETEGARWIADGVLAGASQPCAIASQEWRDAVRPHLLEQTRDQMKVGLEQIRAGNAPDAVNRFMLLAETAPAELTAQVLANLVTAVVLAWRGGHSVAAQLPAAKSALDRLMDQFPDYERLPGLLHAFAQLPAAAAGGTAL